MRRATDPTRTLAAMACVVALAGCGSDSTDPTAAGMAPVAATVTVTTPAAVATVTAATPVRPNAATTRALERVDAYNDGIEAVIKAIATCDMATMFPEAADEFTKKCRATFTGDLSGALDSATQIAADARDAASTESFGCGQAMQTIASEAAAVASAIYQARIDTDPTAGEGKLSDATREALRTNAQFVDDTPRAVCGA